MVGYSSDNNKKLYSLTCYFSVCRDFCFMLLFLDEYPYFPLLAEVSPGQAMLSTIAVNKSTFNSKYSYKSTGSSFLHLLSLDNEYGGDSTAVCSMTQNPVCECEEIQHVTH